MTRGPLYRDDYAHQLSGHETFPLRYGWLKKAYDAVAADGGEAETRAVFGDDAIVRFGVGKNMVASIRHWAQAVGILEESSNFKVVRVTALGHKLFGSNGLDPYMEDPASLWLIHWQLAGRPNKTTWFWAFNHFPGVTFERELFVKGLERLAKDRSWARVASATIKNDVACFIRTYVAQQPQGRIGHDDALESPLAELGLIRAVGRRDGFRFVRGAKSSLGSGVFAYALLEFWSRHSSAATLSLEAVAHEPGSPGRVFLLDENDVADRLVDLDEATSGALRWSETAGLKQVVRDPAVSPGDALRFVGSDFATVARREAA
jgi:hypothetical protein